MKGKIYFIVIITSVITACSYIENKTNSNTSYQLTQKQEYIDSLKSEKIVIDTLFNQNKDKLLIFVKFGDNNEIMQIQNENYPNNITSTFNILKDSEGKIITISEFPFSESGDWNIIFTHYFDKDGKTFAFEKQANFFNSICTDGVAYENQTKYYSTDFQLIDDKYSLIDQNGKELTILNCQFPYNFDYKIFKDISEFLQTNKIENYENK